MLLRDYGRSVMIKRSEYNEKSYIRFLSFQSVWISASICLIAAFVLGAFINSIVIQNILIFIGIAGAAVAAIRISARGLNNIPEELSKNTDNETIRKYCCSCKRKLLISTICCIALLPVIYASMLGTIHSVNLSFRQKLAAGNAGVVAIGLFFVLKNLLRYCCVYTFQNRSYIKAFNDFIKKIILYSAVFWIIVAVGLMLTHSKIDSLSKIYRALLIISIGYAILFIAYVMNSRRKYLEIQERVGWYNKTVSVLIVSCLLIYAFVPVDSWWIQPYILSVPSVKHDVCPIDYNDENGIYTITMDRSDFKILQLTDIHLGGTVFSYSYDILALKAVYNLIKYTEPDLVIITGDFVYPRGAFPFLSDNYKLIIQFASYMRNIGVPWAFTYGNHDCEAVLSHNTDQINDLFSVFSYAESSSNLLYSSKQPDITGRSNQIIKILNKDGTLNQVLFLLDSNSYTTDDGDEYDYIHDDQVEWYSKSVSELNEEYGKPVSSLMFFHIPLKEYKIAYDLYKQGSNEVKYYCGAVNEYNEEICASKHDSKMFDAVCDLKSTKAIFVGHDHYNNISLEYRGVRLTYGLSIDYLVMPGIAGRTWQRGGTLITLKENSSYSIDQIRLSDIIN